MSCILIYRTFVLYSASIAQCSYNSWNIFSNCKIQVCHICWRIVNCHRNSNLLSTIVFMPRKIKLVVANCYFWMNRTMIKKPYEIGLLFITTSTTSKCSMFCSTSHLYELKTSSYLNIFRIRHYYRNLSQQSCQSFFIMYDK